jgi:hypothetical protein
VKAENGAGADNGPGYHRHFLSSSVTSLPKITSGTNAFVLVVLLDFINLIFENAI